MKYKVWCKDSKEWEQHEIFIDKDGDLFHYCHNEMIFLKPPYYIPVFYSGFDDNNQEELYQEDIVKILSPSNQIQQFELIGRIFWNFSSFGIKIIKVNKWEKFSPGVNPPDEIWLLNLHNSNRLILKIGNTFENPELLK